MELLTLFSTKKQGITIVTSLHQVQCGAPLLTSGRLPSGMAPFSSTATFKDLDNQQLNNIYGAAAEESGVKWSCRKSFSSFLMAGSFIAVLLEPRELKLFSFHRIR